jgi:putative transposase
VYRSGACRGQQWRNRQPDKTRSKRGRCQKRSRRYVQRRQVYQRVSERNWNKQRDCLHNAAHLIAAQLGEGATVMGDLSQRRMVPTAHQEKRAERRRTMGLNHAVFNDWGLSRLTQMLEYTCQRFAKELHRIAERSTSQDCSHCGQRQATPLWQRTYRRGACGLAMDRDGDSAVTIRQRFLARLGPHTDASVRRAAPQPQQSFRSHTL